MSLTIRREQMGKLEASREKDFLARLAQHLQAQFPEFAAGPGALSRAVDLAKGSGLSSERDLAKYAATALVMGAGFQPSLYPNQQTEPAQRRALRRGNQSAAASFSRHAPSRAALPCPKKTWIEIRLVGMTGKPVPNERFAIHLPDGSIVEGVLDADGTARVDGIDEGDCRVVFPELDCWAVEPAGSS